MRSPDPFSMLKALDGQAPAVPRRINTDLTNHGAVPGWLLS